MFYGSGKESGASRKPLATYSLLLLLLLLLLLWDVLTDGQT